MSDHSADGVAAPWIFAVRMSGRCANGFERGGGRIIHAVELPGDVANKGVRPSWQKALCGKAPGHKGNGWGDHLYPSDAINCPRCARKLDKECGT